ncbi:MAG: hypothetical protein HOV81_36650 [Kofleriaceae bacterium]|nr:hypothetical protein [Kofleriaceae bacterium]
MGWWNLPGSEDEVMGDEPADAAVSMLRPVAERRPKPTANELLDALEAALRIAGPGVVNGELEEQHITSLEVMRVPGRAPDDVVAILGPGLAGIAGTYRDRFSRPPSLREMLAAITFELRSNPREYLSDFADDTMSKLVLGRHEP